MKRFRYVPLLLFALVAALSLAAGARAAAPAPRLQLERPVKSLAVDAKPPQRLLGAGLGLATPYTVTLQVISPTGAYSRDYVFVVYERGFDLSRSGFGVQEPGRWRAQASTTVAGRSVTSNWVDWRVVSP